MSEPVPRPATIIRAVLPALPSMSNASFASVNSTRSTRSTVSVPNLPCRSAMVSVLPERAMSNPSRAPP